MVGHCNRFKTFSLRPDVILRVLQSSSLHQKTCTILEQPLSRNIEKSAARSQQMLQSGANPIGQRLLQRCRRAALGRRRLERRLDRGVAKRGTSHQKPHSSQCPRLADCTRRCIALYIMKPQLDEFGLRTSWAANGITIHTLLELIASTRLYARCSNSYGLSTQLSLGSHARMLACFDGRDRHSGNLKLSEGLCISCNIRSTMRGKSTRKKQ